MKRKLVKSITIFSPFFCVAFFLIMVVIHHAPQAQNIPEPQPIPPPPMADIFDIITEPAEQDELPAPTQIMQVTYSRLTQIMYCRVRPFAYGFGAVQLGERWGFVNTYGQMQVRTTYDWVSCFAGRFAAVRRNGLYSFIDIHGYEIIPPTFQAVRHNIDTTFFAYGAEAVNIGGLWGLVDYMGNEIVAPTFHWLNPMQNGQWQARVIGYNWGIIDSTGAVVAPFIFYSMWESTNGYTTARVGITDDFGFVSGTWGIISPTGETTWLTQFNTLQFHIGRFYGGLAQVLYGHRRDGLYGFIDTRGREIIPLQFDDARPFYNGLSAVRNGDWGAIAPCGEFVIPLVHVGVPKLLSNGQVLVICEEMGYAKHFSTIDGMILWEFAANTTFLSPVLDNVLVLQQLQLLGSFEDWGAMDAYGNMLVAPMYSKLIVLEYYELILAMYGTDAVLYTLTGQEAARFENWADVVICYSAPIIFTGELIPIKRDGLWGYVRLEIDT